MRVTQAERENRNSDSVYDSERDRDREVRRRERMPERADFQYYM